MIAASRLATMTASEFSADSDLTSQRAMYASPTMSHYILAAVNRLEGSNAYENNSIFTQFSSAKRHIAHIPFPMLPGSCVNRWQLRDIAIQSSSQIRKSRWETFSCGTIAYTNSIRKTWLDSKSSLRLSDPKVFWHLIPQTDGFAEKCKTFEPECVEIGVFRFRGISNWMDDIHQSHIVCRGYKALSVNNSQGATRIHPPKHNPRAAEEEV